MNCVLMTRNFVFKMMNFAAARCCPLLVIYTKSFLNSNRKTAHRRGICPCFVSTFLLKLSGILGTLSGILYPLVHRGFFYQLFLWFALSSGWYVSIYRRKVRNVYPCGTPYTFEAINMSQRFLKN